VYSCSSSAAVLTALWGYALFPLIETRSVIWMVVGLTVAMLPGYMMYGPLAALFTELFGTGLRYSAVSLSYQIGGFGGGLAPIIATSLLATGQITLDANDKISPGESREVLVQFNADPALVAELIPGRIWRIQEGPQLVAMAKVIEIVGGT
jgi:hypothetical protein